MWSTCGCLQGALQDGFNVHVHWFCHYYSVNTHQISCAYQFESGKMRMYTTNCFLGISKSLPTYPQEVAWNRVDSTTLYGEISQRKISNGHFQDGTVWMSDVRVEKLVHSNMNTHLSGIFFESEENDQPYTVFWIHTYDPHL